jgi:hypothetical protein
MASVLIRSAHQPRAASPREDTVKNRTNPGLATCCRFRSEDLSTHHDKPPIYDPAPRQRRRGVGAIPTASKMRGAPAAVLSPSPARDIDWAVTAKEVC